MPAKKLDAKHLDYFKKLLTKIRADMVHDIKNLSANSSESHDSSEDHSGHALHMADVATDMYDREFNLNLASNDREALAKVESALQRLEQGTFGICSECEKPIPQVRLKAIPYTSTCRKCQEELEKNS